MKLFLYSVRDRLLGVYLSPFPSRGDVDAVRQVSASLSDPSMAQTPVGQNPQDFDLCFLGVFDDETGIITSDSPRILSNVADLRKSVGSSTVSS